MSKCNSIPAKKLPEAWFDDPQWCETCRVYRPMTCRPARHPWCVVYH